MIFKCFFTFLVSFFTLNSIASDDVPLYPYKIHGTENMVFVSAATLNDNNAPIHFNKLYFSTDYGEHWEINQEFNCANNPVGCTSSITQIDSHRYQNYLNAYVVVTQRDFNNGGFTTSLLYKATTQDSIIQNWELIEEIPGEISQFSANEHGVFLLNNQHDIQWCDNISFDETNCQSVLNDQYTQPIKFDIQGNELYIIESHNILVKQLDNKTEPKIIHTLPSRIDYGNNVYDEQYFENFSVARAQMSLPPLDSIYAIKVIINKPKNKNGITLLNDDEPVKEYYICSFDYQVDTAHSSDITCKDDKPAGYHPDDDAHNLISSYFTTHSMTDKHSHLANFSIYKNDTGNDGGSIYSLRGAPNRINHAKRAEGSVGFFTSDFEVDTMSQKIYILADGDRAFRCNTTTPHSIKEDCDLIIKGSDSRP